MVPSRFNCKEDSIKLWSIEASDIQNKIHILGNVSLVEGLYPTPKNTIQYMGNVFSDSSGLFSRTLKANAAFAEKTAAGGGMISIITALATLEELKKTPGRLKTREQAKARLQEYIQNLQQPLHADNLDEIISWCFNQNKRGKELQELTLAAIEMVGMNGNVRMEKVASGINLVEKHYGYTFPIKGNKYMFQDERARWEFSEAKVFCIDGMVESVAELDKILRGAFDSKAPTAIIAQDFSEEVVATVITNNKRKAFNVGLFELEQSLNNMNVISDFSIVCGPNCLLSVFTGELMALANYDELPTVDFFSGGRTGVAIRNTKTRKAVNAHINSLLAKRLDYVGQVGGDDLGSLVENRIKNLLANTVTITTSDETIGEVKETEIALDNALRSIRSAVSFGLIDLKDFKLEGSDPYTKAINVAVKRVSTAVEGRKIPVISLLMGIVKGLDPVSELMESTGVIVIETEH